MEDQAEQPFPEGTAVNSNPCLPKAVPPTGEPGCWLLRLRAPIPPSADTSFPRAALQAPAPNPWGRTCATSGALPFTGRVLCATAARWLKGKTRQKGEKEQVTWQTQHCGLQKAAELEEPPTNAAGHRLISKQSLHLAEWRAWFSVACVVLMAHPDNLILLK